MSICICRLEFDDMWFTTIDKWSSFVAVVFRTVNRFTKLTSLVLICGLPQYSTFNT